MADNNKEISVTVDFVAGGILVKAMRYYVENFEDAAKELKASVEEMGEEGPVAMAAFALTVGMALDGVRNQILKKGERKGWGSDEHRNEWCKEKEEEILPHSRYR